MDEVKLQYIDSTSADAEKYIITYYSYENFSFKESKFKTFDQFKKAVADYIDYYNNHRIKSKTKWMPPSKFREASMLAL